MSANVCMKQAFPIAWCYNFKIMVCFAEQYTGATVIWAFEKVFNTELYKNCNV